MTTTLLPSDLFPHFRAEGYADAPALVQLAADTRSQRALAQKWRVPPELLWQAANYLALLSLRGIGTIYAELLEAAGVTTIPQLAAWDPVALHARLCLLGREHEPPVFRLPSLTAVTSWVRQAEMLTLNNLAPSPRF